MTASEHVLMKISSGRWLLTMAAATTFCYLRARGIITGDKAADIIQMVFIFYFMKKATENGKWINECPIHTICYKNSYRILNHMKTISCTNIFKLYHFLYNLFSFTRICI